TKVKDKYAARADVLNQDKSVVSGLTIEQMAGNKNANTWQSNKTSEGKEKPVVLSKKEVATLIKQGETKAMPSGLRPMKCELIDQPFDSEDWIYELKLDGYRIISYVNGKRVTLTSAEVQDYTKRYSVAADELKLLNHKAVLDGEIVAVNDEGKPDFSLLQNYKGQGLLIYYVFDILWIDDYDIIYLPLIDRKRVLQSILPDSSIV